MLESRFPVRVKRWAIRQGSGGRNLHRGGDGIIRELEFLSPMTVTVLSSNRETQAFGVQGGAPGQPCENSVLTQDGSVELLNGNDCREMRPGEVLLMKAPGGGYGQVAGATKCAAE